MKRQGRFHERKRAEEGRISAKGMLDVRFTVPESGRRWMIRVSVIVVLIATTTVLILVSARYPDELRVIVGFLLHVVG